MGSRYILYSHYWAHHGNDPSRMTIIQLQDSSKSRYWTAKFISDGARKKTQEMAQGASELRYSPLSEN